MGRFASTFGRYEVRAKLPGGKGNFIPSYLYYSFSPFTLFQDCGRPFGSFLSTYVGQLGVNSTFWKPLATSIKCIDKSTIPSFFYYYYFFIYCNCCFYLFRFGTVHFSPKCYSGIANGSVYDAPFDYTQDYHVYAFEWNQTSLSWYLFLLSLFYPHLLLLFPFVFCRFVDDVNYYVVYDNEVYKGQPFALDTSPHYWILNTAVGGNSPFSMFA